MASWFDLKGTTLNFFSVGIKKTKFDSSVVTVERTFKLPNAAVDMSGGSTGQVLGIISGTSIGWISKENLITGAASTITTSNLTVSRAVISNGLGKIDVSATTSTELGYLSGVTSAVQAQLNNKLENGINLGTGSQVFKIKSGVDLEFRTLVAGERIELSSDDNEITIKATDTTIISKIAGETLAARDYVYISSGTGNDSGRTAGRIYKVDPNFEDRVDSIGFCMAGGNIGDTISVKFDEKMTGFSSLTEGRIYYASSSTPGAITDTAPTQNNQWILVVGIASSSTELIINPVASSSAILITSEEISFSIANNQSVAADVTGMVFDPIGTKAFFVDYYITRSTGSSNVVQVGQLRGGYNTFNNTWYMSDDYSAQNAGVNFSILSSGQIQYTSSDIPTSTGTIKYAPRRVFN